MSTVYILEDTIYVQGLTYIGLNDKLYIYIYIYAHRVKVRYIKVRGFIN